MQPTIHIEARMNQRGIRRALVDLAVDLGEVEGDRYILSSKIIDREMSSLQDKLKLLCEARKKGGVVVVASGDALVTTYRAGSFNAKLSKNKKPLLMRSA